MKAIKNKYKTSNFRLSILMIIIVLFAGFSILQPKVLSRTHSIGQENMWNDYLIVLNNNEKNIDTKKFWEFREFYSPGYFVFDRSRLPKNESSQFISKYNISQQIFSNEYYFLKYNSPRITSIEFLSSESSIDKLIEKYKFKADKVLIDGADYKLLELNSSQVLLVFLVPSDEMKKSNGFLDYGERDKDLADGKYWLNLSVVTLP